ncbi:tRNA-intron lyase [Candidatus Pacearchaeota archaeon CG10_big_fil_rev_8_21_14_0_10_34_12]|nr:MAG: tRNA-intron lyase [Candidatus Pacearchaeota archaeon CG10_big_fil_rev_8_21_14_0_10_34_12]
MDKIQAHLSGGVISSNSSDAFSLNDKSNFGERKSGKVIYSFPESLFLVEKGKMEVYSLQGKKIPKEELAKKLQKHDKRIQVKYPVFKDLREKGYVVKTALKFGADFRVYEKGVNIKKSSRHSKWIVFSDKESERLTWHEFSAKNRVAHSTKKNLLLAIVDDEGDITYYEVKWMKP